MYDNEQTEYVYKCGRREKKFIRVKRCCVATARGSDCSGSNLKGREYGIYP